MNDQNPTRPESLSLGFAASQPERTASNDRSERQCKRCGRPLTGKRVNYCGDGCRMADYRDQRTRYLTTLLEKLRATMEELEREVLR